MGIEYQGGGFAGWQRQANTSNTIQELLEKALSAVADHPVSTIVAGRTDAGVHACAQVVNMRTEHKRPNRAWVRGTNASLPAAVRVLWAQPVIAEFNARFSAVARCYRYIFCDRPSQPAISAGLLTWVGGHRLDENSMHLAAQSLVGEHDFSSFKAAGCQSRSPVRRVDKVTVWRRDSLVVVEITANAFLYRMVRNIAGVLKSVGLGEKPVSWMAEVLSLKQRSAAIVTAPARGLYLVGVKYPTEHKIPSDSMSGPLFLLS